MHKLPDTNEDMVYVQEEINNFFDFFNNAVQYQEYCILERYN